MHVFSDAAYDLKRGNTTLCLESRTIFWSSEMNGNWFFGSCRDTQGCDRLFGLTTSFKNSIIWKCYD